MSNTVNETLIAPEAYEIIKDYGFSIRKGPDKSVSETGKKYVTIAGLRKPEGLGIPILASTPEIAWKMFRAALEIFFEEEARPLDVYVTFRTYPELKSITFENLYTYYYVYSRLVTE
ncbi:MAG TPA: hypothetical protein VFM18_10780 [Methanosarcina sp.]|nr:hypothetical protein [Methanosarcina sp.]